MNILRQLWQDAQSVVRDMSVTQRVAVSFLILTVAVLLTFAAWLGSSPGEIGRRPLPIEVEPGEVNEILAQLRAKGIRTAEYDFESRRIVVNTDDERRAIIGLAEEGLLRDAHEFGFLSMLEQWSFSDPTKKSDEAMRIARANEVARLIESLDPIREAQVIYSDDARNSLFGISHKKTASVRVKTGLRKALDEGTANTIIALVANAKAGLDARDVVVTDQMGNKFHATASNGLTALARQKWDYEYAEDEKLRRKLENLMRQYIPNIQYEGDVNAFPKHEIDFDYREQLYKEVLPGEVLTNAQRKTTEVSTQRPYEEPGVNPNVRRVANLGGSVIPFINDTRMEEKTSERSMQNSIRETATKFSPRVSNLTISAIIHLPYQLRRDEEGRPVQAVNEVGESLIDPETRLPMWERESVTPIPAASIEELKRQIAQAAGIPLSEIPEKIEVSQIPWMPPVHAPVGGEPFASLAIKTVTQNMTAIMTFLFFAMAIYIAYRFATRPIPTEIDDPIEQETLSLAMSNDDDDDDLGDEAWDRLRAKVMAAVQEDPKRAANLVKRWMRKD